MNSVVKFLKERKGHGSPELPARGTPGSSTSHREVEERDLDLPSPESVVDAPYVQHLAKTRQIARYEQSAAIKRYHYGKARKIFRKYVVEARSYLVQIERRIAEMRPRLAESKRQKKLFERFGTPGQEQGDKKPCTRWTQTLFAIVVLVMVIAILNGTFSVSSVMLDSTAFSGQYAKTITVAMGFFLLPGLGLSIPFHLLRSRPRYAKFYLAGLISIGTACGFLFAVTWAHTYAVETGNQLMIDLTMIGMGGEESEALKPKPWLFENANWLNLLFQILADMCFAGAAKSYLTYLTWNYRLFRDKSLQQDLQWLALDQEVRDLIQETADLEREKCRAEEHMTDLDAQQEEYTDAVCNFADTLFMQEVDKMEREDERIRGKQKELHEKEAALRRSQQELDDLLTRNPGLLQKGNRNA